MRHFFLCCKRLFQKQINFYNYAQKTTVPIAATAYIHTFFNNIHNILIINKMTIAPSEVL